MCSKHTLFSSLTVTILYMYRLQPAVMPTLVFDIIPVIPSEGGWKGGICYIATIDHRWYTSGCIPVWKGGSRMKRADNRAWDEIRPVKITPGFQSFAEGSALIELGKTRVLCSNSAQAACPKSPAATMPYVSLLLTILSFRSVYEAAASAANENKKKNRKGVIQKHALFRRSAAGMQSCCPCSQVSCLVRSAQRP